VAQKGVEELQKRFIRAPRNATFGHLARVLAPFLQVLRSVLHCTTCRLIAAAGAA
jgi:hypothetical protein